MSVSAPRCSRKTPERCRCLHAVADPGSRRWERGAGTGTGMQQARCIAQQHRRRDCELASARPRDAAAAVRCRLRSHPLLGAELLPSCCATQGMAIVPGVRRCGGAAQGSKQASAQQQRGSTLVDAAQRGPASIAMCPASGGSKRAQTGAAQRCGRTQALLQRASLAGRSAAACASRHSGPAQPSAPLDEGLPPLQLSRRDCHAAGCSRALLAPSLASICAAAAARQLDTRPTPAGHSCCPSRRGSSSAAHLRSRREAAACACALRLRCEVAARRGAASAPERLAWWERRSDAAGGLLHRCTHSGAAAVCSGASCGPCSRAWRAARSTATAAAPAGVRRRRGSTQTDGSRSEEGSLAAAALQHPPFSRDAHGSQPQPPGGSRRRGQFRGQHRAAPGSSHLHFARRSGGRDLPSMMAMRARSRRWALPRAVSAAPPRRDRRQRQLLRPPTA